MEKKKMTKKQKRIIVVCVILVAAIIAGIVAVTLKNDKKLEVETVKAGKQTINETLDITGTVSADSESDFVMPDGAKVTSVLVKVGDHVKTGQLLATFDTSSLEDALSAKESAYEQAQSAYVRAKSQSKTSQGKIDSVKSEIAQLEKKIEKSSNQTTTAKAEKKAVETSAGVSVSDSLVKRFVRIAKLIGIEYTETEAKKVLEKALSSGNSLGDIKSMMDSMSAMSDYSNFDMSSFASMGMSDEFTLAQLKAQLASLELQSNDTYISTYKMIAEKAQKSYADTKAQIEKMRNGWKAESEGIVSEVNIEVGSTVTKGSAKTGDMSSILSAVTSGGDITSMLTSMFDNNAVAIKVLQYPLVANISLNKYDVLDVKLNQDVSVKSANGQIHSGKVSFISATATQSSGLNLGSLMGSTGNSGSVIPAQVTIDSADSSIIVGTDVEVSIVTDTAENATVVPVEAVCIDGEDIFVYVLDEDKSVAVRKDITLGISNDTYYQVTDGVSEGDVLIKNTSGLEDGIKVAVR